MATPVPKQDSHQPCFELYENSRGSSSAKLRLHEGQARRVENTRTLPRSITCTTPLPRSSASCSSRAQLALGLRADDDLADRQLDRVLAEAVEARPRRGRQELAVHPQAFVALAGRPLGEVGVVALARHHQRREEADAPALGLAQQSRRDRVRALRLDRHLAVRAVLGAELDVEQAQEVVDLGQRRHRALAAAAAGALLDRHRRRDAEDGIDVGAAGRLHELPRVGVERFEVAALALGEHDVEGERGLARAGHAGDDGEAVARNRDVDVAQVVLAGAVDDDRTLRRVGDLQQCAAAGSRQRLPGFAERGGEQVPAPGLVVPQRAPGVRRLAFHDLLRRAGRDQPAAGLAALGPEVDDPVGGADDVEVVLDDDQRVARVEQPPERAEQLRDVVEVQARGRLVEQEQRARCRRLGQVTGELEALRLAARQRGHRLAEAQVVEADRRQRLERSRTSRSPAKNTAASDTVMSSTSAMLLAAPSPRASFTSSTSGR